MQPEAEVGIKRELFLHDGALVSSTTQDCTPIAEYCKARHNEGLTGSSEMRLAASIPFVMVEKYLNDNNITLRDFTVDKSHIRRLLSDPAMDHFRIWKGKL